MLLLAQHPFRELIEHRKKGRRIDLTVAHAPGELQLLPEYTGWRLGGLRRRVDDEALRTRSQAARCFQQHVVGLGLLAELVQLVNKYANGLFAADGFAVCRHNL